MSFRASACWRDRLATRAVLTHAHKPLNFTRRHTLSDGIKLSFTALVSSGASSALATDEIQAQVVQGKGYKFIVPPDWIRQTKAGADSLTSSPDSLSSVGVTVAPVRVQNITQFGTLNDVAEKLIAAEKKKESTISVDLLDTHATGIVSTEEPAIAFSLEYELQSTRGRKRIVNLVSIYGSRLYIVNCQRKCPSGVCSDDAVAELREIADSFSLHV